MLDVLIVEDDVATSEALVTCLGRLHLSCRTAGDLAAARAELASSAPDLVLLDLELPDGSGLELFPLLADLPDTDVVMTSGKTTVDSAIQALRLGAHDFLTKPIALPRLAATVKSLMGQSLETAEGLELGEVDDVAIDLGTGMVSYVIVSTGGVLGLGESLHAIGFDTLTLNSGSVSIVMNKESLSKLPTRDIERLAINPVRPVALKVDRDTRVGDRNQRN